MLERVRRRRAVKLVLDVHGRVGELGGGILAAGVTLALFVSLFPMVLVAIAVAGFISAGDSTFATDVIRTLGLRGDAATTVVEALDSAERSKRAASIIGFVGLVWSALGVVGAVQHVLDRAWQIESRGLKGKLWAALWLVGALVLLGGAFTLSSLLSVLPGWAAPLSLLGGLVLNVVFFLWTFKVLTGRSLPFSDHLPGAILGGVGFQTLTAFGAFYVPRLVSSSSALYGSIGAVFAVLAWLALLGRLLVYSAALNVVLHERACGTVRVEVQAPRFNGEVALSANRSAVITRRAG